jgi:ABC-type transporter Mla MlaB component
VADVLMQAGRVDRAITVLHQAEAAADRIFGRYEEYEMVAELRAVAESWAGVGQSDRADEVRGRAQADPVSGQPHQWQQQWRARSEWLVLAGEVDEAERSARSMDPGRHSEPLQILAEVLVLAGQIDRAEAVARSITHVHHQSKVLRSVVETLTQAGRMETS